MDKNTIHQIFTIVCKALTLAMGVAVVVLSRLGELEAQSALTMLGIGLASAGISMFAKQ